LIRRRVGEPFDQSRNIPNRRRPAEQISLQVRAILQRKMDCLRIGLHPLGGDGHSERLAKPDDRTDDRHRTLVVWQVLDEAAVDLDLVEREAAQIAQRRISGSEIVHRDLHP
jgi:hypothetical protein